MSPSYDLAAIYNGEVDRAKGHAKHLKALNSKAQVTKIEIAQALALAIGTRAHEALRMTPAEFADEYVPIAREFAGRDFAKAYIKELHRVTREVASRRTLNEISGVSIATADRVVRDLRADGELPPSEQSGRVREGRARAGLPTAGGKVPGARKLAEELPQLGSTANISNALKDLREEGELPPSSASEARKAALPGASTLQSLIPQLGSVRTVSNAFRELREEGELPASSRAEAIVRGKAAAKARREQDELPGAPTLQGMIPGVGLTTVSAALRELREEGAIPSAGGRGNQRGPRNPAPPAEEGHTCPNCGYDLR